jgi:hypothetical protein
LSWLAHRRVRIYKEAQINVVNAKNAPVTSLPLSVSLNRRNEYLPKQRAEIMNEKWVAAILPVLAEL